MGEGNPSRSQPGQQVLDFGRPFPGVDAFGPVHVAEDGHDGAHHDRIDGVTDHQNAQIVAYHAASALALAENFTFGAAGTARVIALYSGAAQADRPGIGAVGAPGEHAVMAAARTGPVSPHGAVEAAVAELLPGPRGAQRVDHPVAAAALEVAGRDAWASSRGRPSGGFNRHRGSPGPGRAVRPC